MPQIRPASLSYADMLGSTLPHGISANASDENARLLEQLHAQQDELEQQARLLKQLETTLQRAQSTNQELALMADSVADAIVLCDANRCINWVNPAFTKLTGFTLPECIGQLPEEILSGPHTDAASVARVNQSLAQGANIDRLQACLHRQDGAPFWVSRSVQAVCGPDGHVSRYIEVLTDITAQRHAEVEHTRRLQAEAALADKVELIARMSHSMRSPLNSILSFTHLLTMADAQQWPEGRRPHLQRIAAAGSQMLSLLDQAQEFAQLNDKTLELRPQRVGVPALLREIRAALDDEAKARGVNVLIECPAMAAWADAQRTRSILINLLRNAIQHSPEGSSILLTGQLGPTEQACIVEVRDQGFGIDQSDLPRLFQPFTRLDSSRSNQHGNGLGLAVSQRLAELMHGRIEVSSALGHGSTFTLHLPLAEAQSSGHTNGLGPEMPVILPPLRIVHVQDNALHRSQVEAVFADHAQVQLFWAESANEGMTAIEANRPDVVLIDINLPDGSGLEMCRRLRAQPMFHQLPLLALSTDAMPDHIARALQTGFNHYLIKPLQIPRLLGILSTLPTR